MAANLAFFYVPDFCLRKLVIMCVSKNVKTFVQLLLNISSIIVDFQACRNPWPNGFDI